VSATSEDGSTLKDDAIETCVTRPTRPGHPHRWGSWSRKRRGACPVASMTRIMQCLVRLKLSWASSDTPRELITSTGRRFALPV